MSFANSVACLSLVALLHNVLHEHDHLFFRDLSVAVLVHGCESILEFRLVVVVGRRDVLHDLGQEIFRFFLVKLACFVDVEFVPDLLDGILVDAVLFDLCGHPVGECLVDSEE